MKTFKPLLQLLIVSGAVTIITTTAYSDDSTNTPASRPPAASDTPTNHPPLASTNTWNIPGFNIMGGIVTLSPFEIGGSAHNFSLTKNSTKVLGIIQANYSDRYAWEGTNDWIDSTNGQTKVSWCNEGFPFPPVDFQARIGYVFNQDATNASTVLGSGDFYGEFATGLRIWETEDKAAPFVHSVNLPEMNLCIVTDRQFADVHPTLTIGPAYVASHSVSWTPDRFRILVRSGAAFYDLPKLGADSSVETDRQGNPKFHPVWGWAVETEASVPLGNGLAVSAGARVYPEHYPAPWTVWVGGSISLDKIRNILPLPHFLTDAPSS